MLVTAGDPRRLFTALSKSRVEDIVYAKITAYDQYKRPISPLEFESVFMEGTPVLCDVSFRR